MENYGKSTMCTSFPNGKPWMSIAVLVPTQSIIPSKLADYRGSQGSQSMGSGILPFFNQQFKSYMKQYTDTVPGISGIQVYITMLVMAIWSDSVR